MLQKFGLYEFLANLIPGLALISALSWLAEFFGHKPVLPITGAVGEASALIAWSYIVGLLLQGIAEGIVEKILLAVTGGYPSWRWMIEGGKGFTPEHRAMLKDAIREYFGEPVEPTIPLNAALQPVRDAKRRKYQELFYLCLNLVEQKKLSDRPLSFNTHYSLFRGLLTFTLLLLPVFGWALAFNWTEIAHRNAVGHFQLILSLLFVAAIVSYFRMIKRGEDFAKSIYDLFFSFYRQEASGKK
ncbi:MAG TPA: hypothetical protein VKO18_00195 [Terriglobia bacterium]|nr:hypothetical protein [Terriglobia bacterium]